MTDTKFSSLGLAEPILRALEAREHFVPTPIQAQSIPALLDGQDVLGIAQTGTGKTGAFVLPLLDRLSRDKPMRGPRGPKALILAPTRELAIQIGEEIKQYAKHQKVFHTVIFGGVKASQQIKTLARGIDIVVATPGRLLDLHQQGHMLLDYVDYLVLDEADRMLDMGFIRDVRKIIAALPKRRQSLLFSATMPRDIEHLCEDILTEPKRVSVTPQSTPIERIRQCVHFVLASGKQALLSSLLSDPSMSRVIVFVRMKHRANRVAESLVKNGIPADAIHGNKSQNARQAALKRFKSGDVRVLVATDIAARGIDIDNITHVVNFELPNEPESYVHRIGRTARAGASGIAVSFCDPTEYVYLRDIERITGVEIEPVGDVPAASIRPVPQKQKRHGGKPKGNKPKGNRNTGSKKPANSNPPRRRRRRAA